MNTYERHIELLGYRARDKVTGFIGVIDSVCFDAYGCIQLCVKPPMSRNGEVPQGCWFDVTRLEIDTKERVVDMPNFYEGYVADGRKGASVKPEMRG